MSTALRNSAGLGRTCTTAAFASDITHSREGDWGIDPQTPFTYASTVVRYNMAIFRVKSPGSFSAQSFSLDATDWHDLHDAVGEEALLRDKHVVDCEWPDDQRYSLLLRNLDHDLSRNARQHVAPRVGGVIRDLWFIQVLCVGGVCSLASRTIKTLLMLPLWR